MQPSWNSQLEELLAPREWVASDPFLIECLFDETVFPDDVVKGFELVVRSSLPHSHVAQIFRHILEGDGDFMREDLIVCPKNWGAELEGDVHRHLVDVLAERRYHPELESAWRASHGKDTSVYYHAVAYSLEALSGIADVPHRFFAEECTRALRGAQGGYREHYDNMRLAISEMLQAYRWHNDLLPVWELLLDEHSHVFHDRVRDVALERFSTVTGIPDGLISRFGALSR